MFMFYVTKRWNEEKNLQNSTATKKQNKNAEFGTRFIFNF